MWEDLLSVCKCAICKYLTTSTNIKICKFRKIFYKYEMDLQIHKCGDLYQKWMVWEDTLSVCKYVTCKN